MVYHYYYSPWHFSHFTQTHKYTHSVCCVCTNNERLFNNTVDVKFIEFFLLGLESKEYPVANKELTAETLLKYILSSTLFLVYTYSCRSHIVWEAERQTYVILVCFNLRRMYTIWHTRRLIAWHIGGWCGGGGSLERLQVPVILRRIVVRLVVEGSVRRPVHHLLSVHHVTHPCLGSISPTWTPPTREHWH